MTSIDGWVNGKKIQTDARAADTGGDAAAKLLAASNLTTTLNPGQKIDKDIWQIEVASGIEKNRPHVRVQYGESRLVEGKLNGQKSKFSISEVVFFEPTDAGPVCLWARDREKYYFANQISGQAELVNWLARIQGK
jgi:hypothetical protein